MLLRAPLLAIALCAFAEDWPEWRGRGRTGVWRETDILERFPAQGLRVRWRFPVRGGYAGPAVAGGRVFVTDYADGVERLLALDERAGSLLWKHEWPADYRGLDYATGPRATPTVDAEPRLRARRQRRASLRRVGDRPPALAARLRARLRSGGSWPGA